MITELESKMVLSLFLSSLSYTHTLKEREGGSLTPTWVWRLGALVIYNYKSEIYYSLLRLGTRNRSYSQ